MLTAHDLHALTSFAFPLATLVLLAGGVIQAIKVLIILPLLPQENQYQDMVTRVVAFLVCYGVVVLNVAVDTHLKAGYLWQLLGSATSLFLMVTGGWHLFTAAAETIAAMRTGSAQSASAPGRTTTNDTTVARPTVGVAATRGTLTPTVVTDVTGTTTTPALDVLPTDPATGEA